MKTQEIIHQGYIVVLLCLTIAVTILPVEAILPGRVVTQHATYVHAQQVMEEKARQNIAMEGEYARRLVNKRPAVMLDASVTQVTKETNAKHKVQVIPYD